MRTTSILVAEAEHTGGDITRTAAMRLSIPQETVTGAQ